MTEDTKARTAGEAGCPIPALPINDDMPRDGSLLRLLVRIPPEEDDVDHHPMEDVAPGSPFWTVGSATFDEDPDEIEWNIVGWCWSHDHFTEGKAQVLGWLPFHGEAAAQAAAQHSAGQAGGGGALGALKPFAEEAEAWGSAYTTCIPDDDLVMEHAANGDGWLEKITVGDFRRAKAVFDRLAAAPSPASPDDGPDVREAIAWVDGAEHRPGCQYWRNLGFGKTCCDCGRDDVLAALRSSRAPSAEQAGREWQDISTAPKDGTEIILFHPQGGVCAGFCPGEGSAWHVMDGQNTFTSRGGHSLPALTSYVSPPTHWMPMPAQPAAPSAEQAGRALSADEVEWVVNDIAELGVKIGQQFFFLYKGESLVYDPPEHDDGTPMHWRRVWKREFGECAHPLSYDDPTRIGSVSLNDSGEWRPIRPAQPAAGSDADA